MFLSLKNHFTTDSYDFFTYNGKLKASKEAYDSRNDKLFFERVAKEYSATELKDFFVSNLLADRLYITTMIEEGTDALNEYKKYIARKQSLSYVFGEECDYLFSTYNLDEIFATKANGYPMIVISYLQGKISIDTLTILDEFVKFRTKFDDFYQNDVIWRKLSMKINKYRGFCNFDRNKTKKILLEQVNDLMTKPI